MCTMSPSENNLRQALRELAAAAPRGAPPELGSRLQDIFARHHSRRRRWRSAAAASLAACLAISIALAWWGSGKQPLPATAKKNPHFVSTPPATTTPAQPPVQASPTPHAALLAHVTKAKVGNVSKGHRARPLAPPDLGSTEFFALPSFDPAVPIGQARILRVEMPGSALQLVGYPVNEELLQRRVVTDMLVGQDGVPYAVRLVQTRVNH